MRKTINLFGYYKNDVDLFFDKIDLELKGLSYTVKERYYETEVEISGNAEMLEEYNDAVRRFGEAFKNVIYGIDEENVYKCAFKLLKEKGIKIAFAEGVSGGRIASEFIASAEEDVKNVLVQVDVVLSEESQAKRFGIDPKFFEKNKLESVEAVYELARGSLYVSGANMVIATEGTTNESSIDNGKCFIAVGDNQVINVFKHTFSGSKNKIMQQIAKYSFLHLIRKLRENNLDYLTR